VPRGKETQNQMGLFCGQENSVLFKSLATLHNLSADPLAPKIESLVSTPCISLHVKLNLLLLNEDRDMEDDNEADDIAIDREGSPNPYSDDEGSKDFLKEDLSVHDEDFTLGDDFNTLSEVSSGVFSTTHSSQFDQPNNFKQLL
jgi:hypothetical protein